MKMEGGSELREAQLAFRQLCVDYEDVLDEGSDLTPVIDERIGLALFKIDEATAVLDVMRQEASESYDALMNALVKNCQELEDIFIKIHLMEAFVGQAQAKTRELEARLDASTKAADPVFNTTGVSTLLRTLSIKRPSNETTQSTLVKWEPIDLELKANALIERLEEANATSLGVSITNRLGGSN